MSSGPRDPRAPQPPQSPDELPGGIRGRVSGVTRIGGRALVVGFVVVTALLLAILYGITKKPPTPVASTTTVTAPVAQPSDLADFGQGVPVVATAAPETPPPPFLEPATAVPNVASQPAPAPPVVEAPPVESPGAAAADAAAAAAAAAEAKKLADEQKAREEALDAARRSKILTGQASDQGGGGTGGSESSGLGGMQTAFTGTAGNEAGGTSSAASSAGSGGASSGATGGASGRGTSQSLLGRGTTGLEPAVQPTDDLSYLSGPTHQYSVQRANILLPPGGNAKDFLQAQRFQPISPFQISATSVIPAELITGVSSEKTGLLSAQVREDVYDTKTGRYLLIPQGTRLLGLYQSATGYGSSRISVAWERLIFPDTTSIDLQDMTGLDTGGFSGLGGTVDNHYGKIFGAALLTSVLAAGVALSSGQQNQSALYPTVGSQVTQQISQNVLGIGEQITNKALSLPPTVFVSRGYPFLVFVDRDIVLPGPYGSGL